MLESKLVLCNLQDTSAAQNYLPTRTRETEKAPTDITSLIACVRLFRGCPVFSCERTEHSDRITKTMNYEFKYELFVIRATTFVTSFWKTITVPHLGAILRTSDVDIFTTVQITNLNHKETNVTSLPLTTEEQKALVKTCSNILKRYLDGKTKEAMNFLKYCLKAPNCLTWTRNRTEITTEAGDIKIMIKAVENRTMWGHQTKYSAMLFLYPEGERSYHVLKSISCRELENLYKSVVKTYPKK